MLLPPPRLLLRLSAPRNRPPRSGPAAPGAARSGGPGKLEARPRPQHGGRRGAGTRGSRRPFVSRGGAAEGTFDPAETHRAGSAGAAPWAWTVVPTTPGAATSRRGPPCWLPPFLLGVSSTGVPIAHPSGPACLSPSVHPPGPIALSLPHLTAPPSQHPDSPCFPY